MVRYVYIQFNQSSVPLLYAIRGEWFVMFTSPSGLLSQLSSSFSVGLMRVPAGHHTFPLLVKEPVLHCRKRGENFQKYLLWGPASLSEHEASHLYWQARPQHAFSTHASLAVTGTQVVYGKRQPLPRPGYSIFNQFQSMFNICSINVQWHALRITFCASTGHTSGNVQCHALRITFCASPACSNLMLLSSTHTSENYN